MTDPDDLLPGDGSNLYNPIRAHVEAALEEARDSYPPPVDALLRLGDARRADQQGRIARLGLTQEHVPDLVRLARDQRLNTLEEDSDEVWGPINAVLALKNLDASAHIADLIALFDLDSDWFSDVVPEILAHIGEPALEPLRAYLQDQARWVYGRASAAHALVEIAKQHPELRERAVRILADALEPFDGNVPEMNAFLITNLVNDLKAAEALPTIRRAFEADQVDESVMGDWVDALEELDQEIDPNDPLVMRSREHRRTEPTRRQAVPWLGAPGSSDGAPAPPKPRQESVSKKRKSKRKMAVASRKANRKNKRR